MMRSLIGLRAPDVHRADWLREVQATADRLRCLAACCPPGAARMAWCSERRPECRRHPHRARRIAPQGDDSAATAQGALGCSTSTYARVRGGGIGSSLSWDSWINRKRAESSIAAIFI